MNNIEVFIINYNGKNTIIQTIESLYNSKNVSITISIIDDHSTDNSIDLIKEKYPEISITIMPHNTKRANILRNKALEMAENEYIFITDNDLKYDENCLGIMLEHMKSDDKIATCTPRMMFWDDPNKIYVAGTKVHFIGAAISEQRDKIYEKSDEKISTNSGSGICLIRKSITDEIGGFDLNLMQGWGSDGELYQRLLRAGYKCHYVPAAFALHEDKLIVTNRKYRVIGQTYNRWVFILSHYSFSLIVLLIPAFIVYEFVNLSFVLIKGIFIQYLKGNLLLFKNYKYILKKRKFVQSKKIISDKEILYSGPIYVAPALLEKFKFLEVGINLLSKFFNVYWKTVSNVIS